MKLLDDTPLSSNLKHQSLIDNIKRYTFLNLATLINPAQLPRIDILFRKSTFSVDSHKKPRVKLKTAFNVILPCHVVYQLY